MRTTREDKKHFYEIFEKNYAGNDIEAAIYLTAHEILVPYRNIVEAIGKIERRDLMKSKGEDYYVHSGANHMLDRINTIIKEGGGG